MIQENLATVAAELPKIKFILSENEFIVEAEYDQAINSIFRDLAELSGRELNLTLSQELVARMRFINEEYSGKSTTIDTFPWDYL